METTKNNDYNCDENYNLNIHITVRNKNYKKLTIAVLRRRVKLIRKDLKKIKECDLVFSFHLTLFVLLSILLYLVLLFK